MTAAAWEALSTTGACADLTDGVRLRLTGPDAVRYLNGQVTNDVRKLRPGHALPACVTNHKGKLEAWVYLCPDPAGGILIAADGDLRDFLPVRLEKYLIADNCVLEDLTETTALCHLTGPPTTHAALLAGGEHLVENPRFGVPGADLWTTPERLRFWKKHFPTLTAEDQSTLEVIHGIPAWGHELTSDLLPPEACLDATAIDYHKGCYIGQEVISRIRSVGRVNRFLASLLQTSGPPAEPGLEVRPGQPAPSETTADFNTPADSPAPASAPAGTLTRAATHPVTGQCHALAFLRRGTIGPLFSPSGPGGIPATFSIRKTLDD